MNTTNLIHAIQQKMQIIHDTLPTPNVQDVKEYEFLLQSLRTLSAESSEFTYTFFDQLVDVFTSTTELVMANAESLYIITRNTDL